MPPTWRSNAAQIFVAGRIAKIDQYWARSLIWDLFFLIEEWDLWEVAFRNPKTAKDMKKDWQTFQGGPTFKDKVLGSKRSLGTEIFDSVQPNVVQPLQQRFTSSHLTINFNAKGWFGTQAGFPDYKSMWDLRKTDADLNVNPSIDNPAHVRAKADRWALYGQFGKDDTKAEMQLAGQKTGTSMNLPHVKMTGQLGSGSETFFYSPKKAAVTDSQVFAALNYGHRQHGSNIHYGKSYFELDDDLKDDAFYFAMDTFTPVSTGMGYKTKAQRSKLYQVSANAFGGAILLAIKSQYDENKNKTSERLSKLLAKDLLEAAQNGPPKADTDENHLMIEAHIFREVLMKPGYINRVFVSRNEIAGAPNAVSNIKAFTQKTGIPHHYIP